MNEAEIKEILRNLDEIVSNYGDQLKGMSKRDKKMFGLGIYCGCNLHQQLIDIRKKEQEEQWVKNNGDIDGF